MTNNDYLCSDEFTRFYNKWKMDHGNTDKIDNHNIYFLKTVDRDGNVTGEAIAMNVTLKNYFRARFSTGSSLPQFSRVNMCLIGNGIYGENEDVSTTDTGLRAQTYTEPATFTGTNMSRIDGSTFYWDDDNSVLWANCKLYEGYFDYTLSGISGDLSITEIGLGYMYYSTRYLFTHALVYDNNGERTTFVKHVGEKLIITAYARILHKPELETRMWNQGYAFMWNPWGCIGFGESVSGDWEFSTGEANSMDSGMISSPRYETSNSSINNYDVPSTNPNRAGIICKKSITILEGTWDDTNQTATRSITCNDVNTLIEAKDKYYDMFVAVFHNTYYNSGSGRLDYCSQGAVFKPISLPEPEAIETESAYCRNVDSGDVSVNFGYIQNSKLDARGMLPVTNMNVSSVKSYNGLTHDWDIDETLTNGTNTTNLTMFQLYPWCGIYMYNKYMSDGIVKWGRFFDRIYANIYTSYPITSFDTTAQVWCTDTYWDTSSWEYIPDNSNVSAAHGTKKYYIRFDGSSGITGSGPSANLSGKAPMLVTRSGYTVPSIQVNALVTTSNVDPYSNGAAGGIDWSGAFMMGDYGTNGKRVHLSNDTMGYIYMSNKIYYPELGTSFDIVTSNGTGNCRESIPTLRFTEPSGHRVLQIFRASNNDNYFTPQLSKVSVFDIPSSTDLGQDPSLTPTEYIVELGSSFSNSIKYDSWADYRITSTETGYVIFSNPTSNRAHVVNLLGNAPDYEPYQEIIKYPGTNDPATTYQIYAIKYTNNAVMIDYTITTSTDYGFTIFSLVDGSIIDQFTIPKNIWTANGGSLRHIVGWNGYLFISGQTTSSWGGEWKCRIYDPTRAQGSRVVDPGWGTTLSKCIVPRGDSYNEAYFFWNRLIDPHTYGDDTCIVFENSYDSNNHYNIYYLDASNITSVVNISSSLNLPYDGHYDNKNSSMSACTMSFNDNKQKILCININTKSNTNNCLFMDLNYIRDQRKGPTYVNIGTAAIPNITPYYALSTSGIYTLNSSYRALCTYKGKVVLSEYSNRFRTINSLYVVDTDTNTRFIDPNILIPHKMSGTTTTIQAYNNPKRIYGINNITIKFINDAEKWYPPAE